MKSPLAYQTSEYDCGPTTLLNAMRYLFDRKQIPPDVVKHIMLYSLDSYNTKGELGKHGTSAMAMLFLSGWLNHFGKVSRFPIHCTFLAPDDVYIGQGSRLVAGLQQGGVAVVRLWYGGWHYVLFTAADDKSICVFDPYYRKKRIALEGIEMIDDAPTKMNRRIAYSVFNSEKRTPYALGPRSMREATLIFNLETQKTPEKTIEYFI